MEYLFFFCFFTIVYHYLIFPMGTIALGLVWGKEVSKRDGDFLPTVTMIVAAYNEEKVIEEKILNCFELDFPRNKREIIVVSDGSTDRTPEIVRSFEAQGVVGLFTPERRGKTAALNRAVSEAKGEIVLFSDANTHYERDVLKKLIRNFHEPSVGGVCGRKSIIDAEGRESGLGDKLFWKFESTLKTSQSRIGSITTGDGEIFAIRKSLYSEIPEEIINDDMAITLNIIRQGYRVVYEPDALSSELSSISLDDDFEVKARMICGGYQSLQYYSSFLLDLQNPFALQFFSHKLLRWCMWLFLMGMLISSTLAEGMFFRFVFGFQAIFYSLAFMGMIHRKRPNVPAYLYVPLYYTFMNLAAAQGFLFFLAGRKGVSIWKKAER